MPTTDENLFAYAHTCVRNPGLLTRVAHSGKLHALRSAFSSPGSFASKAASLVGAGARATVNCIPIPVVGSLIASVEQAVEKAIRSNLHGRAKQLAISKPDQVKFELKELNIENLDRYRWKVKESMEQFNEKIRSFEVDYMNKANAGAPCDALLEFAMAAEQATKRTDKLRRECAAIFAAMKLTMDWLDECDNGPAAVPAGSPQATGAQTPPPPPPAPATAGINGAKNRMQDNIKAKIQTMLDQVNRYQTEADRQAFVAARHGGCGAWCCVKNEQGAVDNWATAKERAAAVMRTLSDPFVPDSFNNNLGSLW